MKGEFRFSILDNELKIDRNPKINILFLLSFHICNKYLTRQFDLFWVNMLLLVELLCETVRKNVLHA